MIICTTCDLPFNPKEDGAQFAPLPVCAECVDMNEQQDETMWNWLGTI